MSKTKEMMMHHWQETLDSIFKHIDGDDNVLSARAAVIKRLVGDNIDGWKKIDRAHTLTIDEDFAVMRIGLHAPAKPFKVSDLS